MGDGVKEELFPASNGLFSMGDDSEDEIADRPMPIDCDWPPKGIL